MEGTFEADYNEIVDTNGQSFDFRADSVVTLGTYTTQYLDVESGTCPVVRRNFTWIDFIDTNSTS